MFPAAMNSDRECEINENSSSKHDSHSDIEMSTEMPTAWSDVNVPKSWPELFGTWTYDSHKIPLLNQNFRNFKWYSETSAESDDSEISASNDRKHGNPEDSPGGYSSEDMKQRYKKHCRLSETEASGDHEADEDTWIKTNSFGVSEISELLDLDLTKVFSLGPLKENFSEISNFWQPSSFQSFDFNPYSVVQNGIQEKQVETDAERIPMVVSVEDLSYFQLQNGAFFNVKELSLRCCIFGPEELSLLALLFPRTESLSLSEKWIKQSGILKRCDTPKQSSTYKSQFAHVKKRICDFRKNQQQLYANPRTVALIDLCLRHFPELERLQLYKGPFIR